MVLREPVGCQPSRWEPLSRVGGHGTGPSGFGEYIAARRTFLGASGSVEAPADGAPLAGDADLLPLGLPPRTAFVKGPAARAFRHCLMSVRCSAAGRIELYPCGRVQSSS